MKIVLTGSSGKVGRACAAELLGHGHEVIGVDARYRRDAPHPLVVASLLDADALYPVFERLGGADALVHVANHPYYRSSAAGTILRENLAMNSAVFMQAIAAGVGRIVFCSSVQAMMAPGSWGQRGASPVPPRLPLDESIEPRPSNTYGLSKLLSERMLDGLCGVGGVDAAGGGGAGEVTAVSLRLPWVATREEALSSHAGRQRAADEERWLDFQMADASSYVFSDDAGAALRLAAGCPAAGHRVVFVSAPDPRARMPVAELVERRFAAVPGADEAVRRGALVDCSKAYELLGWLPRGSLADPEDRTPMRGAVT